MFFCAKSHFFRSFEFVREKKNVYKCITEYYSLSQDKCHTIVYQYQKHCRCLSYMKSNVQSLIKVIASAPRSDRYAQWANSQIERMTYEQSNLQRTLRACNHALISTLLWHRFIDILVSILLENKLMHKAHRSFCRSFYS